jgi:hypothetical protein
MSCKQQWPWLNERQIQKNCITSVIVWLVVSIINRPLNKSSAMGRNSIGKSKDPPILSKVRQQFDKSDIGYVKVDYQVQ